MPDPNRTQIGPVSFVHDTVLDTRPASESLTFTVIRVGEIWTLKDIDALETVCREMCLRIERIDDADPKSARNLSRPVIIQGRTAKHKAADFAGRMRALTPGVEWLVVELK